MAIEMPLGPLYPKTLLNSAWQKKKSFLDKAKSKTKTGLGAELENLEREWKKIEWEVMDARMQGKWASLEALQAGKKKAQKYKLERITKFYNVVMKTSRKAKATAQIAGLSNTAKTAALAIANETEKIGGRLMGIEFDDFDEEEKRIRAGWERWRQRLPKNVADLEDALKDLEKDPRNAKWNDMNMTDFFRAVGNSLGNNPEFKDLWPKPWADFDGLQNTRHPKLKNLKNTGPQPTQDEREAILELIEEVRPHIAKLKKRL